MALVDHVIVLSHLQPQVMYAPPTQTWEETLRKLGMEEHIIAALPPSARQQPVGAAGEAKVSHSALDIRPSGIRVEVDWPCGCGAPLHGHHDFALSAWARHVAQIENIDPDHLEAHAVQEIEARWRPDATPRVHCRCGEHFTARGHLPDDALAAWEQHARAT